MSASQAEHAGPIPVQCSKFMNKKEYNISGFDCPNCAAKVEHHLSKQKEISSVRLDYSKNKLYISYKEKEFTLDELVKVIKEVESDPLNINEVGSSISLDNKIFTKKMKITLIRILFSITIIFICLFGLAQANLAWLRFSLYVFAIFVIGYDIFYKVILHIKNRTSILDHNLLITIASFGSLALAIIELINEDHASFIHGPVALDDSMEGLMVIVLFQIGSIIENVATNKSKAAIMSAVELRVDKANLLTQDGVKVVKPEELKIGDSIIVKTGELIPIDGEIVEGFGYIDSSSLTGEYVPIMAKENDAVYGGCLLKDGTLTIKVNKLYEDSTVSKIIELIESGGEKKSDADVFIAKFARIYTPIVVILAILSFLIGGIIASSTGVNNAWLTWVHTGLEILVIGCPCAIVISVPLAYFSGLGLASKHGIVIKGSNYLDELSKLGKLISDKTGTLTRGSFSIQEKHPIGVKEDELINKLLIVESLSSHPIGKAILHDYKETKIPTGKNFKEVVGLGCEIDYKKEHIVAGGEKLFIKRNIDYPKVLENGSIVYCAVNNKCIGYVILRDTIKDDAQPMVDLLHSKGVEIILLTGDDEDNAKAICNKLGIDRWHSNLLPKDKIDILEEEMKNYNKKVAFIGDGINDAPSIIRSDIGIAMGGIGSDVAVSNSDIVIMNDDPAKVYDAMVIANKARHTALFNIVFALLIKIAVFILALVFPDASYMMYVAVAADTGLTVLLVINSLLLLYRPLKRKVK